VCVTIKENRDLQNYVRKRAENMGKTVAGGCQGTGHVMKILRGCKYTYVFPVEVGVVLHTVHIVCKSEPKPKAFGCDA